MSGGGEDSRDDFELMAAIDAGDSHALATLYRRHGPQVYAICVRVLDDRHEAEDVLLDVFGELWEKADRYHPSRGAPRTYLVMLARSRAIDRKRSRSSHGGRPVGTSVVDRRASDSGPVEVDVSPHQSALDAERRRIVDEAVAGLDAAQREAISLAFFEGLSHREIAERLATPLGTIKSRIRTGLTRIREALSRFFEEQGEA